MCFRARHFWLCLVLYFTTLGFIPSHALQGNTVRLEPFDWLHVQTDHFDIYYDKDSEKLLPRMAHYLEKAWVEVGEIYNYQVPGRTPFFFFSNHNLFEQNNIVSIGEGTGGVTEAFKNRFLIFNDGSEKWLRHVIPHEFTHVVQFNIIYGGFWKSIRLLKSPFLPLWVMEGTAEVGAGEVDEAQTEMVVRDAVATNTLIELPELHGFAHLKPNQVTLGYKTGEMAIRFLEDEYGKGKAGALILLMRDYFDISSALETLIGCDLDRFNFRFKEWLTDRYAPIFDRAKQPSFYGPQLTHSDGIPQFNESPVVSHDGKKIYFFSDRTGQMLLYELDTQSGKTQRLFDSKWKLFENIHSGGRALSLSSDGKWLAFAGEKKQQDYLYLFDLHRKKLKRIRVPFDEVRSPVFSPTNPDQILIVGMSQGFNDLYLIDRKAHIKQRLTDTPQNEKDPTFSADNKRVYFSGEMMTPDFNEPAGTDLFELDIETKNLRKITDFVGEELEPEALPNGNIVFVRNMNDNGEWGFNLYELAYSCQTPSAITDLIGGGFSPRVVGNTLFYVGFYHGEKHLFQMPFERPPLISKENLTTTTDEDNRDPFWDEPPSLESKTVSSWDRIYSSSNLRTPNRPYRFQASTDLFIPFFFYSSLDGFVFANIFQGSDLLGNHQVQQQLQYASEDKFLDLAVFYTYAKNRPDFTVGVLNREYYEDIDQNIRRRETTGVGILTYPLDRVSSVNLMVGMNQEKKTYEDFSESKLVNRDHFWSAGYSWDTITGRYLIPTQGTRLSLTYQKGTSLLGANRVYNTLLTEGVNYWAFPKESTLATRLFYGRSTGPEPQEFRLGGVDRIRAIPRRGDNNNKHNVLLFNNEFRIRMAYLDARTSFMFPDFFFKAAYLLVFNDMGLGWDTPSEREQIKLNKVNNTSGIGIAWPTFIMQTFQLQFSIQYAKSTDSGSDIWYITIGPSF